jgi:hypothetical protein
MITGLLLISARQLPAQTIPNYVEIRVRNDNAGDISNWLDSGDDLGETQSFTLIYCNKKWHPRLNFKFQWESVEYSSLVDVTGYPRDIYFTELHDFLFETDNQKQIGRIYYAAGAGLYYIQSRNITFGATGQKYLVHNWLLDKFYPGKEWEYVESGEPDHYFPYFEIKSGYADNLFQRSHFALYIQTHFGARISGNYNFTGLFNRSNLDFRFIFNAARFKEIALENEAYYQTNLTSYQIAYLQSGLKFRFKTISLFTSLWWPLEKNLNNPYIRQNDMELMFNYGLVVEF